MGCGHCECDMVELFDMLTHHLLVVVVVTDYGSRW